MKNQNTQTSQPKKQKLIAFILAFVVLLGAGVFAFVLPSMTEEAPPSLSLGTSGLQGFIGTGTYVKFTESDLDRTADFRNVDERNFGVQHYYAEEDISFKEIVDSIVPNDTELKCMVAVYKAEDTNFSTFPKGPYKDTLEVSKSDIDDFVVDAGNGFVLVCSDDYGTVDIFGADEKPSDFLYSLDDQPAGWHLAAAPSDSALKSAVTGCSRRIQSVWVQADDNFFVKVDKNDPKLEDDFYMVWVKLSGASGTCEADSTYEPVDVLTQCLADNNMDKYDWMDDSCFTGLSGTDKGAAAAIYEMCADESDIDDEILECMDVAFGEDGTTCANEALRNARSEICSNNVWVTCDVSGRKILNDKYTCNGTIWRLTTPVFVDVCDSTTNNTLSADQSKFCKNNVWVVCDSSLTVAAAALITSEFTCNGTKWVAKTTPPADPTCTNNTLSTDQSKFCKNNVWVVCNSSLTDAAAALITDRFTCDHTTNKWVAVPVAPPADPNECTANNTLSADQSKFCKNNVWVVCDSSLTVAAAALITDDFTCNGTKWIAKTTPPADPNMCPTNNTLSTDQTKFCKNNVWVVCNSSLTDAAAALVTNEFTCNGTKWVAKTTPPADTITTKGGVVCDEAHLAANIDKRTADKKFICEQYFGAPKWVECVGGVFENLTAFPPYICHGSQWISCLDTNVSVPGYTCVGNAWVAVPVATPADNTCTTADIDDRTADKKFICEQYFGAPKWVECVGGVFENLTAFPPYICHGSQWLKCTDNVPVLGYGCIDIEWVKNACTDGELRADDSEICDTGAWKTCKNSLKDTLSSDSRYLCPSTLSNTNKWTACILGDAQNSLSEIYECVFPDTTGTWVEKTTCSTANGTPINNDYSKVCLNGEVVVCDGEYLDQNLPNRYVDAYYNMECSYTDTSSNGNCIDGGCGYYEWNKVSKNSPS